MPASLRSDGVRDHPGTPFGFPPELAFSFAGIPNRSLLPGLDSYSQSAVLYHLVRSQARDLLKNAHAADADVYNCHIILSHLIPRLVDSAEPLTWERVWQRSEEARIPKVMTFGKHKGSAITDIPADYKRWLLGQPDVDPYLAKALRGEAA